MVRKYRIGLLVGRFQPFHKGHLHLIKESFRYVDKMVFGVGSVGAVDKDNFLTYEERKEMLEAVIEQEGWRDRITKTVPLKDFFDDKLWLDNCLKQAGRIDVAISNNEWTSGIFERAGYPVLRLGFYNRDLYEGVKIRKQIAQGKRWQDRVPSYLIKFIESKQNKIKNYKLSKN